MYVTIGVKDVPQRRRIPLMNLSFIFIMFNVMTRMVYQCHFSKGKVNSLIFIVYFKS